MEDVSAILDDVKTFDWKKRTKALEDLVVLALHAPREAESMRMGDLLANQMLDRRSSVVKAASDATITLAEALGSKFNKSAEAIISRVNENLQVRIAVIRGSTDKAISSLVEHCPSSNVLAALCRPVLYSKSAEIRSHCTKYLAASIVKQTQPWNATESQEILRNALLHSLQDSDPSARAHARSAVAAMANDNHELVQSILAVLNPSTLKQILRAEPQLHTLADCPEAHKKVAVPEERAWKRPVEQQKRPEVRTPRASKPVRAKLTETPISICISKPATPVSTPKGPPGLRVALTPRIEDTPARPVPKPAAISFARVSAPTPKKQEIILEKENCVSVENAENEANIGKPKSPVKHKVTFADQQDELVQKDTKPRFNEYMDKLVSLLGDASSASSFDVRIDTMVQVQEFILEDVSLFQKLQTKKRWKRLQIDSDIICLLITRLEENHPKTARQAVLTFHTLLPFISTSEDFAELYYGDALFALYTVQRRYTNLYELADAAVEEMIPIIALFKNCPAMFSNIIHKVQGDAFFRCIEDLGRICQFEGRPSWSKKHMHLLRRAFEERGYPEGYQDLLQYRKRNITAVRTSPVKIDIIEPEEEEFFDANVLDFEDFEGEFIEEQLQEEHEEDNRVEMPDITCELKSIFEKAQSFNGRVRFKAYEAAAALHKTYGGQVFDAMRTHASTSNDPLMLASISVMEEYTSRIDTN